MRSLTVLLPEALVGLAALGCLLEPRLGGSRRGWPPAAAAVLLLVALALELTEGAQVVTLFHGGFSQDRFALFAKAALLLAALLVLLASDWRELGGTGVGLALLACFGGLVAASAGDLALLWAGLELAVLASLAMAVVAAVGVIAALADLCADGVDVIVVARGGGSFEDLLPFSDERLVRAVAACPVPIVSAVGHEQDTPLCDLAADVRASTPTMAGKLVVPELSELSGRLDRARESLARCARRTLERDAQRLERSAERLRAAPRLVLERQGQRVERAHERLRRAPALAVERKRAALESTAGRLRVLSPQKTLQRGYAIVRTESKVVTASTDVAAGIRVDVRVAEGAFGARVEDIESRRLDGGLQGAEVPALPVPERE